MAAIAIGIGTPIFLVIQVLVALFVYREASAHDSRSPLALAITIFATSLVAAFVLNSVGYVLLAQGILIALYLIAVPRNRSTIPQ